MVVDRLDFSQHADKRPQQEHDADAHKHAFRQGGEKTVDEIKWILKHGALRWQPLVKRLYQHVAHSEAPGYGKKQRQNGYDGKKRGVCQRAGKSLDVFVKKRLNREVDNL